MIPFKLTPRELEILAAVAAGLTRRQIVQSIGVSMDTLRVHAKSINSKTGTPKRGRGRTAHSALLAAQAGYRLRLPDQPHPHRRGEKRCHNCPDWSRT